VIKREDTNEESDTIELKEPLEAFRAGQNIRRQGENASTGALVLSPGTEITSQRRVALATFGADPVRVFKRIRLSIVNTGDELIEPGFPVQPWQIRDSNGPLLASLVNRLTWVELINRTRVADQYDVLKDRLHRELQSSNALLLTGGVSMGDTDHVPCVLRDLGARIVFHKLPIRPGKPVLGAIGPNGQAILALPGNPVSVAATALRIALPILRFLGGFECFMPAPARVQLAEADQKSIPLHWYRPIQLLDTTTDGIPRVRLTPNLGSGDVVALSSSDGFVEIPADCKTSSGPYNCWMFDR
jgi:molybdopterin molybdotransferase